MTMKLQEFKGRAPEKKVSIKSSSGCKKQHQMVEETKTDTFENTEIVCVLPNGVTCIWVWHVYIKRPGKIATVFQVDRMECVRAKTSRMHLYIYIYVCVYLIRCLVSTATSEMATVTTTTVTSIREWEWVRKKNWMAKFKWNFMHLHINIRQPISVFSNGKWIQWHKTIAFTQWASKKKNKKRAHRLRHIETQEREWEIERLRERRWNRERERGGEGEREREIERVWEREKWALWMRLLKLYINMSIKGSE